MSHLSTHPQSRCRLRFARGQHQRRAHGHERYGDDPSDVSHGSALKVVQREGDQRGQRGAADPEDHVHADGEHKADAHGAAVEEAQAPVGERDQDEQGRADPAQGDEGHGLRRLSVVGGGGLQAQDSFRAKQILPLKLHIGGDTSARLPIEDSLRPALVVAQGGGELARAAKPVDKGCVVHGVLNTTFMPVVNTMCVNETFSSETIAPMHASYIRLMEAAKRATMGTPQEVRRPSDLARHLNESPQRVHNWQTRGVSKEGAIAAEKLYGVSATFILEGGEQRPTLPGGPPPPPPLDFADRREYSESDWGLLQDVRLVMSDQELAELRARAAHTRRIAQAQLKTVSASAAESGRTATERKINDAISQSTSARKHSK